MKRFLFITALGIILWLLASIGYLLTSNFWDNRNPFMKAHMWEVTQTWTGVPDLPDDAKKFQIKTFGDFLTRKFTSSFSAPKSSIESWLSRIPDFEKAERSELPGRVVEYFGSGREGATYYKLNLNPEMTEVHLFVSWN
ncbi:hypothetical protein [Roseimicrobium sp. ORNL1]|uniref:hypothetical protein n=1 Tax=Roseimicrobium sp. ORNL1 TaxID=2711231 RepID=UPI0013E1A498|nr:hypothetical protein [Roseimicrobium sp. ORNL1]QIF02483.1 hypothetical protein G5S37_13420 [Roseimicrobium sp. ORNL1]